MTIIEVLVNGLIVGSVYLFFAQSFTLIYGTFHVMNLAQGAVLSVGALVAYWAMADYGLPFFVAALMGAAFAGALNVAIDAVFVRPLTRRQRAGMEAREFAPLVITLSIGSIILGLLQNRTNAQAYTYPEGQFLFRSFEVFGIAISMLEVSLLVLAALVGAGLYYWLTHSHHGLKVRAVAADEMAAGLLGVRSQQVSSIVYMVSGFLAGLVGVVVGLMYNNVNFQMGESYLLLAFVVITVGGLGSLKGTACAAYLIAFLQAAGNQLFTRSTVDLAVFGLLFLILVIRPAGLFGRDSITKGATRA